MLDKKNYTLLVVDDEPELREALAFEYTRKGFQVLSAADGEEALFILAKSKVDLVISDIKMPKMDGLQLLAEIRKNYQLIPAILFVSDGPCSKLAQQVMELGANSVFSKPFVRSELSAAVCKALKIPE